jgi:hypothetical protein
MSHETINWLNRIGLTLGFSSFWFAAPEFIGERRLKMWEMALANFAGKVPRAFGRFALWLLTIGAFGMAISCGFLSHYSKHMSSDNGLFLTPLYCFIIYWIAFVLLFWAHPRLQRLAARTVSSLANDRQQRQRSLFIGAVCFTISFLLQFIATF